MKRNRKQLICTALSVTMALGALSACVPQKTSQPPAATAAPSSHAAAAEGQTEASQETAAFNETGLPIVNQTVTYEMAAKSRHNKNFAELEFFQKLEEETNIHIEWNMSSEDGWKEKKGLLFAGELPDAFYGQGILSDVDVIKYGSQGMLIPLNDLIEQYAPNVKHLLDTNPEYRKQLTAPDGNIYSLPSLTELSPTTHDKLFINKIWLEKLGLEIPETPDEFRDVLIAFRDNDLNGDGRTDDEIPFTFLYSRKENGLFSLFGSFGQLDQLNHFIVKDDKVLYTAVTEPYKEAIEYFHDLYTKQLIDKEGFTHDFNIFTAKLKAPEKNIGSFMAWSLASSTGNNKDDFIAIAPLKGKDGKQIWNTYVSAINAKGSFAITNKAQNPEILMRWIDLHFHPETSLQIDQGLLGRTLEKSSDGTYHYLPVPEGKTFTEMIHDYSPGVNSLGAVTMEIASKLELNANLQERKELDEFYAPYNVPAEEVFPGVYFTMEEVDEISALETDINAYVDQCYANWIVNGGIESEWDEYLKKLEQMHLQDYIDIYQTAYDRYQSIE
ncbi:MAG: extracellular solute-binding protein [Hungatella sp.]|nr:extracellular solute-binding protein [Hungatella sp.]